MPQCKDCNYFDNTLSLSENEGDCLAHDVSTQKVSPEMDTEKCPINKFQPKSR